jgi:hypothetical protein
MDELNSTHEGMHVIDSDGEDLGTVESVVFGEAGESELESVVVGPAPFLGVLASGRLDAEPDVSDEQAERLRQVGYVKVDGRGLFGGHFYVAADGIDHVSGDQVHLRLRRDQVHT